MDSQIDQQLLRDYGQRRSEEAFAELVRRHVDFVYSAALRMVRDTHLAEDVTQAVFAAMARDASQLSHRPALSGWLHRTAQNLAAKAVRTEVRRRVREHEAAAMADISHTGADATWQDLAPHLDAALGQLSEPDRDAVLLRYFERKSAREMAHTLGTTEDAAQKRLNRAVERLRELFAQRGVTVGTSGAAVLISANAVQAAPAGLAATISTATALAGTTLAPTAIATATKAFTMNLLQKYDSSLPLDRKSGMAGRCFSPVKRGDYAGIETTPVGSPPRHHSEHGNKTGSRRDAGSLSARFRREGLA